ncbi:MAG: CoA transferase [Kiloniellales bacterium]|nr:CoA transferase [Kiloniellales bacterium]
MKPLSHFLMLDLTHMLSGPYGTMLLTDMGMRTIKVEPPGRGEGTRKLLSASAEYARDGMGAYFMTLNRSKQSVCIDLKQTEGRDLFYELVERADVVFDNFSPGVTERLGIDHESLARINPRIVTCAVTGFGQTGPNPNRPAFDMVAQGMGGGMSITGMPGGEPTRAGIPIGDLGGGIFGALGTLAALHEREKTGRGRHVDISMLDCQISLLNYMATMHFLSGKSPGPEGNGHFVHVPYNTFRTKTRHIIIAVIFDSFWPKLLEVLGNPALDREDFLEQPGRLAQRAFIEAEIEKVLVTRDAEHWLEALSRQRIPCAPVNDFEHALTDPQVLARNMVVDVPMPGGQPVSMPGNPVKLGAGSDDGFVAPPRRGEHSEEVFTTLLGMKQDRLASLRERGVIE